MKRRVDLRYLVVIPARGGSKGIPNKNLTLLKNKPLIWYTLNAALKSQVKDHVFVSSDSLEILNYCSTQGVRMDYWRPENLATDEAGMSEVLMDVIYHLDKKQSKPENIILLQPTSPLRTATDIDRAIQFFEEQKKSTLVGVCAMREHPFECIKNDLRSGWQFLAKPNKTVSRRQDYKEKFYYINGAMYIVNTDFFLNNKKTIVEGETALFEMAEQNVIDIDEPLDLCLAEGYLNFIEKTEK